MKYRPYVAFAALLLVCSSAIHATEPASDAVKYLQDRILWVTASDLRDGFSTKSLESKLNIAFSKPVELKGPDGTINFASVASAPPFLEAAGVKLIHTQTPAGKPLRSLHIMFGSKEPCVPLQAAVSSPRCTFAKPYMAAAITMPGTPQTFSLQGMVCPKEGNRDVVVRLTAPDQKCIRVVSLSED
ncbi:hypothetical protein SAMN05216350_103103 [Polaromonas sp. YR568]|uniref:hypothetical protein n=1 Tax=Polaromonas sp. YR568 TaxID=1855301 RepID=UPI0008E4AEBE|nr:hypothetical protein [Polaromonas sp. YR568]SFU60820.1 hypothetical protein SAMN05216350_103103 [Polaromonas sp. YR568]